MLLYLVSIYKFFNLIFSYKNSEIIIIEHANNDNDSFVCILIIKKKCLLCATISNS